MQMECTFTSETYMFRVVKAKLSGCERRSFGLQKLSFRNLKHICLGSEGGVKGELKGSERDERGA